MREKLSHSWLRRCLLLAALVCLVLGLAVVAPGGAKAHLAEIGTAGIALAVLGIAWAAARDGLHALGGHWPSDSRRVVAPPARLLAVAGFYLAAFLVLAAAIQAPAVHTWDQAWVRAVHKCGGPLVTRAVRHVSDTAGRELVTCWLPLIVFLLCYRGHSRSLRFLGSVLFGALALETVCKALIPRARPDDIFRLQVDSFPSGHTLVATVLAGALLVIALPGCRGRLQRGALWAVAFLWPLLVAGSRVYLGCHYPTDAAAGMLLGVAWVALSTALLQWTWLRSGMDWRKAKLNGTITTS